MKKNAPFLFLALLVILLGCKTEEAPPPAPKSLAEQVYPDSKPYTRWWWFAQDIQEKDVADQLEWLKANNFGGVEIAWVYPLWRYNYWHKTNYPVDSAGTQKWLSPEWTEIVRYTKTYADSIGLGCDFTFGSSWPAGAGYVPEEDGNIVYGDTSFRQTITFLWEYPTIGRVIDHLDSNAFRRYADPLVKAMKPTLVGRPNAMFTDSWEIKLNSKYKIWTDNFAEKFQEMFGYDLVPYMDQGIDSFPDVRYDYMMTMGELVIDGFYKPYQRKCEELGAASRVQCLASPTDVMTTYSIPDIPETEALLNNANYSRIVSSSAALASKKVVSCETFTCMYGFPGTYKKEENTADLKLLADALFAQGVNHIFYHGMPFAAAEDDSSNFFATVYVGPHGTLSDEFPAFNGYMEKVCNYMRKGRTYTDLAIYIPYEDHIYAGPLPKDQQRVWVWGQYEMRYLYIPQETEGRHPLWINKHFLQKAEFKAGKLKVGEAEFSALLVDVKYLDEGALDAILSLAEAGLPIAFSGKPQQPGKKKSPEYNTKLKKLITLSSVKPTLETLDLAAPLVESTNGDTLPDFWARVEGKDHYIFFSNPLGKRLVYPMWSGQSYQEGNISRPVRITANGKTTEVNLEFAPYQSLMYKVDEDGKLTKEDIVFVPKKPVIRPIEEQRMHF